MADNSTTRRPLTELPQACKWLEYEIWMLYETVKLLPEAKSGTPARNAYLESALVHARALFEFFAPCRPPQGDDVFAEDYFPELWPRREWEPDLRKAIHKRLAHITSTRSPEGAPKFEWPIVQIVHLFDDPIRQFQQAVNARGVSWTPPELPCFPSTVFEELMRAGTSTGTTDAVGNRAQTVRSFQGRMPPDGER